MIAALSALLAGAALALDAALPDMPGELGELSAGIIRGNLYVVGESEPGENDPGPTYSYDFATGKWSDDHPAREFVGDHHGTEVINNKLYLFGGLGHNETQDKVQIFDPLTNSWTLGRNLPYFTGSPNTAVIGDYVYVCGGIDQGEINDTVDTCA